MTRTLAPTAKQKRLQRLGIAVLTGALALTGLTATQVATAAPSEAAVCGSTSQSSGYAYAKNPCGYAYAEVGRSINGKTYYVASKVYKKATSVTWHAGKRAYELTSRW